MFAIKSVRSHEIEVYPLCSNMGRLSGNLRVSYEASMQYIRHYLTL